MNEKSATGVVDLHLHSKASDGIYTPSQLVELAAGYGVKAMALTDHDTFDGIEEASQAGSAYGIEVVPGIELSTYEEDREHHILGYYAKWPNRIVMELKKLRHERYHRMERMVVLLNRLGLRLGLDEVLSAAAPAAPGRLHLARVMVSKGYAGSIRDAFSHYLQRGKPGYVARAALTPEEGADLLKEAGAVAVLAHPGHSGKEMLTRLISLGLQGVEVFHPDHSRALRRQYFNRAHEAGLMITGGSDFHGDLNEGRRPGSESIPYRYLQQIKEIYF